MWELHAGIPRVEPSPSDDLMGHLQYDNYGKGSHWLVATHALAPHSSLRALHLPHMFEPDTQGLPQHDFTRGSRVSASGLAHRCFSRDLAVLAVNQIETVGSASPKRMDSVPSIIMGCVQSNPTDHIDVLHRAANHIASHMSRPLTSPALKH